LKSDRVSGTKKAWTLKACAFEQDLDSPNKGKNIPLHCLCFWTGSWFTIWEKKNIPLHWACLNGHVEVNNVFFHWYLLIFQLMVFFNTVVVWGSSSEIDTFSSKAPFAVFSCSSSSSITLLHSLNHLEAFGVYNWIQKPSLIHSRGFLFIVKMQAPKANHRLIVGC